MAGESSGRWVPGMVACLEPGQPGEFAMGRASVCPAGLEGIQDAVDTIVDHASGRPGGKKLGAEELQRG